MKKLKNIEVELKFPLFNSTGVSRKLNNLAKINKKNEYQKDTYYIPAHRNFLKSDPINEWLRVREAKNGASINYKNWHNTKTKKNVYCDEYETKIAEAESIKKILVVLDFKEIIVVEKLRTTWDYKGVEIAVDRVTNLGEFIELEAKGDFRSIKDATKQLYEVLNELNAKVGEQDFVGYPFLVLNKFLAN